jgi:hypothetical protein
MARARIDHPTRGATVSDNVSLIHPVNSPCPSWCIHKNGPPDTGDGSGRFHQWHEEFPGGYAEDGRNPIHESVDFHLFDRYETSNINLGGDIHGVYAHALIEFETGKLGSVPELLQLADDFEEAARRLRVYAGEHVDDLIGYTPPIDE